MRKVVLAVAAACAVLCAASESKAQVDPVTGLMGLFGVSIPDMIERHEISGLAKSRGRCVYMVSGGKTYSLAAKAAFIPEIPLNKKIRVIGYGIKHGPGLRCFGAIGMVVLNWWPES
jgi:hypothetical protein